MGSLYLASKLEECPLRMRDLINVYDAIGKRAPVLFPAWREVGGIISEERKGRFLIESRQAR